MFSIHCTGKFENTTKTLAILDLCLSKARAVEFAMNIVTSSFSKSFVLKMFSAPTKTQNRRFQILTVSRALAKTSEVPSSNCSGVA